MKGLASVTAWGRLTTCSTREIVRGRVPWLLRLSSGRSELCERLRHSLQGNSRYLLVIALDEQNCRVIMPHNSGQPFVLGGAPWGGHVPAQMRSALL